jgi:Cyclic nucleotide-binding domain
MQILDLQKPRQRLKQGSPFAIGTTLVMPGLRDDLLIGKREFNSRFSCSSRCSLKAGELLAATASLGDVIYRLRSGWACQIRDICDGRRAIIDIYLPGDVIGVDAVLRTRPVAKVLTLTSVSIDAMHVVNGLSTLYCAARSSVFGLMADDLP